MVNRLLSLSRKKRNPAISAIERQEIDLLTLESRIGQPNMINLRNFTTELKAKLHYEKMMDVSFYCIGSTTYPKEKYIEFHPPRDIDVIVASHVIYYFRNKKKALAKMLASLNKDGRIFFVVNGSTADYGPLKIAFSKILDIKYEFTYDELKKLLQGKNFKEYTLPSVINFKTYEELHEILKLSFDTYPEEYEELKPQIIEYFKKNVRGKKFVIDQKIFEVVL